MVRGDAMPDGHGSQRLFAQALKDIANGRIDEAERSAERLRRHAPNDASVHHLLAAVALLAARPSEAERWALSSLATRPDHAATLVVAAFAARDQGHLELALSRFRRAAACDPARPDAAFGAAVAAISLRLDEPSAAIDDLSRQFPNHAAGWMEIGSLMERGRRWNLAARAFGHAVRIQPSAKLCLRLGSALQASGQRGEAATLYQQAIRLDPASQEAWFKLGLALQDGRQPGRAAEAYRNALALCPDLAEAEANLGVVLQDMGDLVAAKQAYGRAINLRPSTFGRIAQALTTAPKGELWMDPAALRDHLSEAGRLSR